jgi:hypothetical protein
MGKSMTAIIRLLRPLALLVVVVCAFVFVDTLVYWRTNSKQCEEELSLLTSHLNRYIKHNGTFPESEKDLVANGYLLKKSNLGGWTYYIPINGPVEESYAESTDANIIDSQGFRCLVYFEDFTMNYGVSLNDIKAVAGKLYDKSESRQAFLIKGPPQFLSIKKSEKASYQLYLTMLDVQRDSHNSTETSSAAGPSERP